MVLIDPVSGAIVVRARAPGRLWSWLVLLYLVAVAFAFARDAIGAPDEAPAYELQVVELLDEGARAAATPCAPRRRP